MSDPLFSIILATARTSYGAIIDKEKTHLLFDTLVSLENQSFRDFELIVIDSLYRSRNLACEIETLGKFSFSWKVTHPISWWLDNHLWALQNAFNTGFAASRGKFLFFCGDCVIFPYDKLQIGADLINLGYWPQFLCVYCSQGQLVDSKNELQCSSVEAAQMQGIWTDRFVRDSRWQFVAKPIGFFHPTMMGWDMIYGHCGIPREDFLYVNGYDENFDGDKALGDVEIGSRLHMAGRWKPCLDKRFFLYEQKHNNIDAQSFKDCETIEQLRAAPAVRANYDLLHLMKKKRIWRANSTQFSEEECKAVCLASITGIDAHQYAYNPKDSRWPYQRYWIEHQANFELKDRVAPIICGTTKPQS